MSGDGSAHTGTESFDALPPAVRDRIAAVKLLILDVDGVQTDGGLYYDADGRVLKRFNVHDSLGVAIARQNGIKTAIITGQNSPAVAARAKTLGIDDYFPGHINKLGSYKTVRNKYGLRNTEIAFLGDDWVDLPVMALAGAPLAVANAQPEVVAKALYVTQAQGGHGAVREAVRLILYCKGVLDQALATWMDLYGS